jgi:hypothetical protein
MADDMVKSLKRCGTCRHARTDQNLDPDLRICREGYGIKHIDNTCRVWEGGEDAES